jgi:hypothetical protein
MAITESTYVQLQNFFNKSDFTGKGGVITDWTVLLFMNMRGVSYSSISRIGIKKDLRPGQACRYKYAPFSLFRDAYVW